MKYVKIWRVNSWENRPKIFTRGWELRPSSLVNLSQRLIGELIVYPCSSIRPSSSSICCSQCSNIFSEAAWSIKAKFCVKPLWVGGTKVCSLHLGHISMMAAMPIYDKIYLQKSSSPEPVDLFQLNLVCIIGDSSTS